MTPIRRLTFAGAAVIAGGMIVALGTRMTWATVTFTSARSSSPGLPTVVLPGGTLSIDGSRLGAGYLSGFGLLLALVPLGWLVAGPRARVALSVAGLAVALAAGIGVGIARGDVSKRSAVIAHREVASAGTSLHVRSGPGIGVSAAGAAVAALGSIAGAVTGGGIPKLGMPERGPE